MEQNKAVTKDEALRKLWRLGNLSWKLDTTQKELYNLFYNSNHRIMTWLLSRRQGKTFTLCILAIEQCIRRPNSIVKFVSPTKMQVNQNVRPIMRKILEDCPEDLRPELREKDYIWYFPNGSEIQLAGSESGHAERLRGGDSDLWFVDEAGSCSQLRDVVRSILLPTTLITNGKGVLASTPPKDSDHDFLAYIEEAELKGSLVIKTIDDNPRITQEQKDALIEELGGEHTEEAQRELYCKIIRDTTRTVIPEFDEKLEKEIVKEWPRPPYYDAYESMDTGGKDFTVVLHAYYDFRAAKIIVEDETVINFQEKDVTIEKLVRDINKKEWELWKSPLTGEYKPPFLRVSDVDYILLNEITNQSKKVLPAGEVIHFQLAKKDDADAALNNLRILIKNRKIIINPKCKTLISHLKNGKWDKNKTRFAHGTDGSHYDAIEALKYLARHIQFTKNPYPANYNINMQDLFVSNPNSYNERTGNQFDVYRKLFNFRSKRKY